MRERERCRVAYFRFDFMGIAMVGYSMDWRCAGMSPRDKGSRKVCIMRWKSIGPLENAMTEAEGSIMSAAKGQYEAYCYRGRSTPHE
jgi:hypothetical protein